MRCAECGSRRDVHGAGHYAGGSYKRAPRWYRSGLCRRCATSLAGHITPGHRTVSRWSVTDVRRIAALP